MMLYGVSYGMKNANVCLAKDYSVLMKLHALPTEVCVCNMYLVEAVLEML